MLKKTQIKIGETIGVVFIVYLIVFFGGSWFLSSQNKSNQEFKETQALIKAYNIYNYVINHPFLRVTITGIIEEDQKLNYLALKTFSNFTNKSIQNELYYKNKLGDSLITINLYNYTGSKLVNFENYTLYNNTKKYSNKKYIGSKNIINAINIYDPSNKKVYFGTINVKVFYDPLS